MYKADELKTMTKADLAGILMQDFGQVPADNARKDDLIEQIMQLQADGQGGPDALLDTNTTAPNADPEAPKQKAIDPEGRTWIRIGNDEHDTGDVFLCHNGDSCTIKRERWAHVKNKFIMGPLNDAVMAMTRDNGVRTVKRRFAVTIWNGPGAPVDSADMEQSVTPLMTA